MYSNVGSFVQDKGQGFFVGPGSDRQLLGGRIDTPIPILTATMKVVPDSYEYSHPTLADAWPGPDVSSWIVGAHNVGRMERAKVSELRWVGELG